MRFFFNSPGKAKQSSSAYSIYAEFEHVGKKIRVNTGIKLQYAHFKPGNNLSVIVTPAYTRDTGFSRHNKINEFREFVAKVEATMEKQAKGLVPGDDFVGVLNQTVKGKPLLESNLLMFYDEYLDYHKSKSPQATVYNISQTRDIISEMHKMFPTEVLNVFKINVGFFDRLRKVCIKKKYQVSTYNKHLKNIKSMMSWAVAMYREAEFNMYFMKENYMKEIPSDVIIVKEREILKLWEHTFADKALEQHRDMFIFQLLSGQRHGELEQLARSLDAIDEEEKVWRAYSSKTHKVQYIPMVPVMMDIYYRYKAEGCFPVRTNGSRNLALKEMFKEAKLDRKVITTEMYLGSGRPVTKVVPLYEAITTHVARASMITILSKRHGTHTVQQISGHASEKDIKRYQGNDLEYIKGIMNQKHADIFNK